MVSRKVLFEQVSSERASFYYAWQFDTGRDLHDIEEKVFFNCRDSVYINFIIFFLEARVEDFISISADDTDFSPSKTKMKSMLAAADLESHGFEKEEITSKRIDKNDGEVFSKAVFYFKIVPCSQASNTTQELKNLLPGKYFPFVYPTFIWFNFYKC